MTVAVEVFRVILGRQIGEKIRDGGVRPIAFAAVQTGQVVWPRHAAFKHSSPLDSVRAVIWHYFGTHLIRLRDKAEAFNR